MNTLKFFSWNVNGIRAIQSKGFLDWLEFQKPDFLCLQEIKAKEEQIDFFLKSPKGYFSYWHSAERPGYSGVAIYSKSKPLNVIYGLGIKEFDCEGRVLILEYEKFYLINAYFPNSQRDTLRLPYKLKFCDAIFKTCHELKNNKNIILCGDYNIAHKEIDLKNPKANEKNAGFLPEERAWMTKFLDSGFIDTFRYFYPDARDRYTWWSQRPGVRERNIGWRIDYFCVNKEFKDYLIAANIHENIMGSDHCPIELEIKVLN
jgi:exodeoxyribonuclease-3